MAMTIFKGGILSVSLMVLNRKEFKAAGQLMAMTIIQEDLQPQLLDKWCYQIISSKSSLGPKDFEPTEEFLSRKTIEKACCIQYLYFYFQS